MQESIPTHLFIDIILSEGCIQVHTINKGSIQVGFFMGPNQRTKVEILLSNEYINRLTAEQYLIQLGLRDLIERGIFND